MKRIGIERWIGVVMIAMVLAVYSQLAGHDFIDFDDGAYILNNTHVRTGLTFENIRWAFTSLEESNWHPLTWISHMMDCQVYGIHPAGHHLTSLFLHVANTLLLFLVLRTATGNLWKSALVAALFGIHPLHIESVAWISERKDVLSGFFWMLIILSYLYYARKGKAYRYLLTLALFALGLMAKPMLVTLPLVLLLFDFWPLGRFTSGVPRSLSYLYYEKIPFFILSIASSVVTYIAQSRGKAVLSLETLSFADRIMNGSISYVRYLLKLVWPQKLAIFYPHPGNAIPLLQCLSAGVLLIVISILVIRFYRQRPFLLFGWFWYLGTLVPVIGILQVGIQSMADRYTYLPSIGVFILLVWSIPEHLFRVYRTRLFLSAAAIFVVICLSVTSWFQLSYWEDTEKIFRHALRVTRNNYVAHCNLGNAMLKQERLEEAAAEYRKALNIWPDYPDAHNNLGLIHAKKGNIEEAMAHYRRAIHIDPQHILAQLNLADALAKSGRLDEAISRYRALLTVHPDNGMAHNTIGVALVEAGEMADAANHFRQAIALCHDCPEPRNNLGRALTLTGRFDLAIGYLHKAISIRPGYAEAYNNLGLLYLNVGALDEAIRSFESALMVRPDYAKAQTNLIHAKEVFGASPMAGP